MTVGRCDMSRHVRAFTLIEVLVVVAIIALLVSILLPSLAAAREQARVVVCKTRLAELFKGHAFYAHDNKNHFPDFDYWLWDGDGGSLKSYFPSLYAKTGGVRPTDSRRWVEFGLIFKYVRDKEVYFCPKDTKLRTGNSIGVPDKPIHSFVRFYEPHTWYRAHIGATADTIQGSPKIYRSDYLSPDQLRPGVFDPKKSFDNVTSLTSVPSRVGLLFEEYQNYGEPPGWAGPNKVSALNDGYSGFMALDDFVSLRHTNRSHILYWDGHINLIEGLKFNAPDNPTKRVGRGYYGMWVAMGGKKP